MRNTDRIRELLHYDPETGVFRWRHKTGRRAAWSVAGGIMSSTGYRRIRIDGKDYLASRLAWAYMTGEFPDHLIDHINRDQIDDRWANLRPANKSQNAANCKVYSNSTSGFKGVHWLKKERRWLAHLAVRGKRLRVGLFDSAEAAHEAYLAAAAQHHGQYATSGQ
jgi:hypothetical protein